MSCMNALYKLKIKHWRFVLSAKEQCDWKIKLILELQFSTQEPVHFTKLLFLLLLDIHQKDLRWAWANKKSRMYY